jgi:homoprotocatechuate degradation regulator HpaR
MLSIHRRKAKPGADMSNIPRKRAAPQRVRMRDVSRSLPLALMRAREATMQYFRPHLRSLAVTEQQWRVLRVLYSAGSIDVTALARRAVLLAPSLTRILRDLEGQHLISRQRVAGDRRRHVVMLTPSGVRLLARGAADSEAAYRRIAKQLGERRLQSLFNLLATLEKALDGNRRRR